MATCVLLAVAVMSSVYRRYKSRSITLPGGTLEYVDYGSITTSLCLIWEYLKARNECNTTLKRCGSIVVSLYSNLGCHILTNAGNISKKAERYLYS